MWHIGDEFWTVKTGSKHRFKLIEQGLVKDVAPLVGTNTTCIFHLELEEFVFVIEDAQGQRSFMLPRVLTALNPVWINRGVR